MSEGRKLEDDEAVIHGKQEAQILGCDFLLLKIPEYSSNPKMSRDPNMNLGYWREWFEEKNEGKEEIE